MPPVELIDNAYVADWRQLRRWGLSAARLPQGTELLFREPTLWQRYRTVVLLTLGVIGAEALLIGSLSPNVADANVLNSWPRSSSVALTRREVRSPTWARGPRR
jgi:hypothetical protein